MIPLDIHTGPKNILHYGSTLDGAVGALGGRKTWGPTGLTSIPRRRQHVPQMKKLSGSSGTVIKKLVSIWVTTLKCTKIDKTYFLSAPIYYC